MRTIKAMLGNDEKVWVHIDSQETWERFVGMAVEEGFHFGELPAEKWAFGYVVAVHRDGDMGHLPLFVWCMSFSRGANSIRKVDFKSYINGAEEYSCEESHFKMRLIS